MAHRGHVLNRGTTRVALLRAPPSAMFVHWPKILFLSPTWPHDRAFGGQMRALHVGRALKQLGRVTLLVVGSDADKTEARERTAAEFELAPPVPEYVRPNHSAARRLRWAFDPRYLNIHGVVASAADRERVGRYVQDFDLVWVMNGRTPNILQLWQWPRGHLDIDDVPSTYFAGAARSGLLQQLGGRTRRLLLHRRERRFRHRFTTLSVCTESDRRYLGGDGIHVIPNGFARPLTAPVRQLGPEPRLGFIGLFSHAPNLEGMRWFLERVWPLVRAKIPEVRLRLVGRDTDGPLRPVAPDVDALGWVDDPADEIATWSAMVIPIHFGGGTRIKVADAFSRKCPVVSTEFGAHGYGAKNGVQMRLARDPAGFAQACVELLQDPLEGAAMAERAWHDFLARWTWDAVTPKVWTAAEDCLRRNGHSARSTVRCA